MLLLFHLPSSAPLRLVDRTWISIIYIILYYYNWNDASTSPTTAVATCKYSLRIMRRPEGTSPWRVDIRPTSAHLLGRRADYVRPFPHPVSHRRRRRQYYIIMISYRTARGRPEGPFGNYVQDYTLDLRAASVCAARVFVVSYPCTVLLLLQATDGLRLCMRFILLYSCRWLLPPKWRKYCGGSRGRSVRIEALGLLDPTIRICSGASHEDDTTTIKYDIVYWIICFLIFSKNANANAPTKYNIIIVEYYINAIRFLI